MDDLQRLESKTYLYLMFLHGLLIIFAFSFFIIGTRLGFHHFNVAVADGLATLLLAHVTARISSRFVMQPFRALWQAIIHVAPESTNIPPPNFEDIRFGRELVVSLANRVYQFASQHDNSEVSNHRMAISQAANVVSHFPLPLFVLNKEQIITNASTATLEYLGVTSAELFGKPLFEIVNLEFPGDTTLEKWMLTCQDSKVTEQQQWQRVRIRLRDGETVLLGDIAAHYNRENVSGTEFIVTFFDRTNTYGQDETNLSFVAMAVHELRTPLTMLRGYIEVFEDELSSSLNQEMLGYMQKLRVSADQLNSFVNNVLDVVKVEENQLVLRLSEQAWAKLIDQAAAAQNLRARILGKNIIYNIAENLPTVAVDPVSISEVINNLLDNAIKYSGTSTDIVVTSSLNHTGWIETSVSDKGVGIPENVLTNLFEKFYRNHRTRSQFGGTGLGLYISKAIVSAHGGQIWVKSKVGEGSTFTFTLQPYAQLADELKKGDTEGIERHAHGWIKNHSYYRK